VEGKVVVLANSESPEVGTATSKIPIPPRAAPTSHTASEDVGSNAILLAAGEQLVATAQRVYAPKQANVASATAWTRHTLVFDASRLSDVVQEFNRYNTRQLVITTPEIERIRVSGVFSSVDPELLLRFLREQPELAVEESDTNIRISRR
jgi:transmembrane sensor